MKKYLILFVLIFFSFGCTARYTLTINDDLSVDEEVVALEDEDFYNGYTNLSKEEVIKVASKFSIAYLNKNNYSRKIVYEGNYSGQEAKIHFNNLDDYYERSKVYRQLFNKLDKTKNKKIITLSLKEQLRSCATCIDRYRVDNCKITIKLPFLVKNHNADIYDENLNSYTWDVELGDDREIYIEFDTSKKVIKSNDDSKVVILIIGTILVIGLVTLGVYISKRKKSNSI